MWGNNWIVYILLRRSMLMYDKRENWMRASYYIWLKGQLIGFIMLNQIPSSNFWKVTEINQCSRLNLCCVRKLVLTNERLQVLNTCSVIPIFEKLELLTTDMGKVQCWTVILMLWKLTQRKIRYYSKYLDVEFGF